MAAILVCQRCKLTMLQHRWRWQRCDNGGTDSAAIDIAVTAMFTLVWQRCAHHCESSGSWQRFRSTVSCYLCHTNVHIVISALSLPLLSQRCARFRWQCTVLVFAVTVLCTSVSNRCGIPLVYLCNTKNINSPSHSSWKVTKPLHETEAKVELAQLERWK